MTNGFHPPRTKKDDKGQDAKPKSAEEVRGAAKTGGEKSSELATQRSPK